VEIRFERTVTGLQPEGAGWRIGMEGGNGARESLVASSVVLASGGLSVPATGSDGTGLRLLRGLGHTVHPLYPALAPLTAASASHASLAGVPLRVGIRAPLERGRFETEGGFLFTHRGYSGPAVLDVSHVAVRHRMEGGAPAQRPLLVRWTGGDEAAWDRTLRAERGGDVGSLLRRRLPTWLADALVHECRVPADRSLAALRREERARLARILAAYPLPWTDGEGYRKAEVTGGGVSLAEVHPRTLESRLAPGLFLCGELLGAFGPIGGDDFLWAWATGRAAGLGAAAGGRGS
jgi:predicted Rossmann fold flavoprotein